MRIKGLLLLLMVPLFALKAWAVPYTFGLQGLEDATLSALISFEYTAKDKYDEISGVYTYPVFPGTLDIRVENRSVVPEDQDPRLTGFVFNVPEAVARINVDESTAPAGWRFYLDPDDIDTPGNQGQFDLGALTGPNLNGGNPNAGIPVGESLYFSIVVEGYEEEDADELDELAFLSLLSTGGNKNTEHPYFLARFQRVGADGEGSDTAIPIGSPMIPVPEPASLLLLATGMIGLARVGRKSKEKRR